MAGLSSRLRLEGKRAMGAPLGRIARWPSPVACPVTPCLYKQGFRTDGKPVQLRENAGRFFFFQSAMGQTKPPAQREHTPVWQIIRSLRPHHRRLLREIEQTKISYWAKQVGKDLVLIPLKLLHILIAGYQPQDQRPFVRYHK
jgi:hypothetical protein